jgi:uncharacterized membrane protein HdeD (DUF308 family)
VTPIETTREPRGGLIPARAWWLPVGLGALSVIAGIVVLANPHSLNALAVVTGIFLLIDGIYEFVTALAAETEARGMVALLGVLCIVAGVVLVRHPGTGVTAVALLLGIWLLATGAVRLAWTVVYDRRLGSALVSVVQLIAGVVIVAIPDIGVATLALLAGIAFILNGVALIAAGWLIRAARSLLE